MLLRASQRDHSSIWVGICVKCYPYLVLNSCVLKDCANRCCNASTCRLAPNSTCATGHCCDLSTCQVLCITHSYLTGFVALTLVFVSSYYSTTAENIEYVNCKLY